MKVEPSNTAGHGADASLLAGMVTAAQAAGRQLLAAFSQDRRPDSREALLDAVRRNEQLVAEALQRDLSVLRPDARWLDEPHETGALPSGPWWVVDAVEGNVNHVHGLRDWAVTVTLVNDGEPVLAVVHQPLDALTWTAVRGGGARCNGRPIRVGAKVQLDAAIVTTGQAEAGQRETHGLIARSVAAMLDQALLVRMSVPSTFPMLQLASGQNDVFWQFSPVLPGVAAGILIVAEAGGVISRIDGTPWGPGAADILLAAPGVHAAAVQALAGGEHTEVA